MAEIITVSLRVHLKNATRDAHATAEARWTQSGGFSSRFAYDGWLERMHLVHAGLGQAAAEGAGWSGAIADEAERAACLAQDLGVSDGTPPERPRLSRPAAWGALYALNGSALGASMLLRGMVPEGWPASYLQLMAGFAKSGRLARFFADLDAAGCDPGAALHGASLVFDTIARP